MKNPGCKAVLGQKDKFEDRFGWFSGENDFLAVLCDGIGSQKDSGQAAEFFVDSLVNSFAEEKSMAGITRGIHKSFEYFSENGFNMGSTAIICHVSREKDKYFLSFSWIGDSRLFIQSKTLIHSLINKNHCTPLSEDFLLLTADDSLVWLKYISKTIMIDDIQTQPDKNILLASFNSNPEYLKKMKLRFSRTEIQKNDKILMCSDGFWELFKEQNDIKTFLKAPSKVFRSIPVHLHKDNISEIHFTVKDSLFNKGTYVQRDQIKTQSQAS